MNPFWVDTGRSLRMAIVPRRRGGDWLEDEIRAIKIAGVDVLVSMPVAEEAKELGLEDEGAICRANGILFHSYPIPDRETPPSAAGFGRFVEELRVELRRGRSVAVHCRASIGRSSLLLASVLCAEGFAVEDAFTRLTIARGLHVPDTTEQVLWVERFAAMLKVDNVWGCRDEAGFQRLGFVLPADPEPSDGVK